MVVKELIEQLKQMEQEMEVWHDNDGRYEESGVVEIVSNGYYKDPFNVVIIR